MIESEISSSILTGCPQICIIGTATDHVFARCIIALDQLLVGLPHSSEAGRGMQ